MKQMRIPLYVTLGIALIGIIFGSFFDLQISTAIASSTSGFGLGVSIVGPTIGFMGLALFGGGFIGLAIHGQYPKWAKALFWVAGIAAYVVSVYFSGTEYFGVNGFYGNIPEWVGFIIAAIPLAGAEVGGYFLFRKTENKYAWVIYLIAFAVLLLTLVAGVTGLKAIFHRPRFRTVSTTAIDFHNWWQPCRDYKNLMQAYGLVSEEFKSFPSGHTAEASILLVTTTFAPLVNPKLKKIQVPCFILAFAFVMLVGFARILAAAHYLSDVSMGASITIVFTIIANEIVIHNKRLQEKTI